MRWIESPMSSFKNPERLQEFPQYGPSRLLGFKAYARAGEEDTQDIHEFKKIHSDPSPEEDSRGWSALCPSFPPNVIISSMLIRVYVTPNEIARSCLRRYESRVCTALARLESG